MLLTGRDQVTGFFGWAIEHKQSVAARSLDLAAIGFDAEREEKVVVAVKNDRLIGRSPRSGHDLQQVVEGHPRFQGALGGQLIGQAIC